MCENEDEVLVLRKKLLDIEDIAYRIENINTIFSSFANEYSPEGSIISGLIGEQIQDLQKILKF